MSLFRLSSAYVTVAMVATMGMAACASGTTSITGETTGEPEAVESATTDPGVGPSAFDRIVGDGRLPSTFKGLVELVEKRTRGRAAVTFIPKGRSLVRNVTTTKDPRIVAAVFTGEPNQLTATDVETHGTGVFMAFSKNAHVVEVISYNEARGRYDFAIIEEFGVAGREPRLHPADRDLCTACHKLGTPVFASGVWSETIHHNSRLLAQTRLAMGASPTNRSLTYEGFEIPETAIEELTVPGQALLDFTTTTSMRLVANDIWGTTCGDSAECRTNLLKYAVLTRAGLSKPGAQRTDLPGYPAARNAFLAIMRASSPAEIRYPSPILLNRDPLTEAPLGAQQDPLLATPGTGAVYRDDVDLFAVATGLELVAGAFNDDDGRRLKEALMARPEATLGGKLDGFSDSWRAMAWATNRGPLRRCEILDAILGQSALGCARVDQRPKATKDTATEGDGPADLEPFRTACGGCHESSVKPYFLEAPKDGKDPKAVFRSWAHCIAPVLDWEAGKRSMPPATSARYAELSADEPLRLRMRGVARIAIEEERALSAAHAPTSLPPQRCPSDPPLDAARVLPIP